VAARAGNETFLTPSGYSLRDMKTDLVVTINETGEILGPASPTKDVNMHLRILRARAEVNIVCHIHGAYIIAASAMLDPGPDAFPSLTPGFVCFAHPLPMIPFMVPGTETLAKTVATQLAKNNSRAVLLQNHGLVALGKDFSEALNIAEEVDEAARIFVLTAGRARVIPADDLDKIG